MRAESMRADSMRADAGSATRLSPLWLAAGAVTVLLLVGTGALWAHYGTAVFYEMVVAGLAACL